MTQQLKSIRVELVSQDRVEIDLANGVLGMTRAEALRLSDALENAAHGRIGPRELWSEGTIGEKVEA